MIFSRGFVEIRSWLSGAFPALALLLLLVTGISPSAFAASNEVSSEDEITERHAALVMAAADADEALTSNLNFFKRQTATAVGELRDMLALVRNDIKAIVPALTPMEIVSQTYPIADQVFAKYGVGSQSIFISDTVTTWKNIEKTGVLSPIPAPAPSSSPEVRRLYQESLDLQKRIVQKGLATQQEIVELSVETIKRTALEKALQETLKDPSVYVIDRMIRKLEMLLRLRLEPKTKSSVPRLKRGSSVPTALS